jgi:hypothetical protein
MKKMKKIIQLGYVNLKILLPFGVALVQILINIMNYIINEKSKNQILEMFGVSFGQILLGIFLLFKLKTINDNIKNKKTRLKGILGLIFGIYLVLNIFASIQSNIYAKNNTSLQNPHNSGLSSIEGLELVFICIFSIKLLKYKYFIHHIISIIIFLLLCIFIDVILENFDDIYNRGALYIILKIVIILLDALDHSYQKYMIDVLFHPFWSIPVTVGVINLICFSIILIACLLTGKEKSFEDQNLMFMSFYQYFDDVGAGKIVIKFILNLILNIVLNIFRILTLVYLRPEYILISFTISRIFDVVLESKKYECLALFVPQLLTLMFYLEIFELNFCGLNKNTRRKIQEREQSEMELNYKMTILNSSERSSLSSNPDQIEVSPDYFVYNEKEKNNEDDNNQDNKFTNKFFELKDKM